MTDLRAALELDGTEDPVFSALKTGDYSNVTACDQFWRSSCHLRAMHEGA